MDPAQSDSETESLDFVGCNTLSVIPVAPPVELDDVSPLQQGAEIVRNTKYSEMWGTLVNSGIGSADHGRGYVDKHEMDDATFEHNLYLQNASRATKRRKRKKLYQNPDDIDNFQGPWVPVLDDQGIEEPSEPVVHPEPSEKVDQKEVSTFHGENILDFKGNTYLNPPASLKPKQHRCYIPKRCIHTWEGHSKSVTKIRLFPQYGHLLLSGSLDCAVKLWDVYNDRKCLRTFSGHSEGIRDMDFTKTGVSFVSLSYDKYVKLWDTESGSCTHRLSTETSPVCVKVSPNVPNIILIGTKRNILQWDTRESVPSVIYRGHEGLVSTVTYLDDENRFVSSSDDKKIYIWQSGSTEPLIQVADPHMPQIASMTLHPSGKYLAGQSIDNTVQIFNCKGKFKLDRKRSFIGHQSSGFTPQVSFSPDGQYLVSGDALGRCFIWDFKKNLFLAAIDAHSKATIGVEWHPIEASRMVTCSLDGLIKYWE